MDSQATDPNIRRDIYCRGCNYNLRGLSREGECPECRLPIEKTLHVPQLKHANQRWLRQVSLGFKLLVIAPLLLAGSLTLALFEPAQNLRHINAWMEDVYYCLLYLLFIGFIASCIAGFVLTTVKDPAEEGLFYKYVYVRVTRAGLIAAPFSWLVFTSFTNSPSVGQVIQLAGAIAFYLLLGTALVAYMLHLKLMAPRLPAKSLAGHTAIVAWGVAISFALMIVTLFLIMLDENVSGSSSVYGGYIISITYPMRLGMTTFSIWYLCLLIAYGLAFHKAARHTLPADRDHRSTLK